MGPWGEQQRLLASDGELVRPSSSEGPAVCEGFQLKAFDKSSLHACVCVTVNFRGR
jgi:hypothetical protein